MPADTWRAGDMDTHKLTAAGTNSSNGQLCSTSGRAESLFPMQTALPHRLLVDCKAALRRFLSLLLW